MINPRIKLAGVALALALVASCSDDANDAPHATPPQPSPTPATAPTTVKPVNPLAAEMGIADRITGMDAEVRNRYLAAMVASGVSWLRMDVEWRAIETSHGRYDWSYYNPSLLSLKKYGLKAAIILGYASEWSSGQPSCARTICAPAATDYAVRAYANAAGATAAHYCGPLYDVQTMELWNEPNLGHYWPRPNPALYTRLIKAAYAKIKTACPHMTVLLGGLGDPRGNPGDTTSVMPVDFLRAVYKHGGKGSFDALSAHPYISGPPRNKAGSDGWGQMLAMRQLMEEQDDGHKQIWITEFAYDSRHVGLDAQAKYLARAVELFRSYTWAGPFFWYSFQDRGEHKFGLLDERGRHKESAQVFGELAEAGS